MIKNIFSDNYRCIKIVPCFGESFKISEDLIQFIVQIYVRLHRAILGKGGEFSLSREISCQAQNK